MFDLERDGLGQVVLCPWLTIWWKQATIPYPIGRHLGQQGLRLLLYTRVELSSMLLVHHQRFVESRKLVAKSSVVPQQPLQLRDRWDRNQDFWQKKRKVSQPQTEVVVGLKTEEDLEDQHWGGPLPYQWLCMFSSIQVSRENCKLNVLWRDSRL